MGFMDKAKGAVNDHSDQVDSGIDKGSDFADEKTGGKYSDQIDKGGDQARDRLDGLDGKDDDFSSKVDSKNDTGQNA
ncbi:hypothetical protein BH23ACT6_BH23ACT6_24650 [soil metagenome]